MDIAQGYSVGLKTSADIGSVAEVYKKAMVEKGWKQTTAIDMGDKTMLAYVKEKRVVNIAIGQGKDGKKVETSILINAPAEEKNSN